MFKGSHTSVSINCQAKKVRSIQDLSKCTFKNNCAYFFTGGVICSGLNK